MQSSVSLSEFNPRSALRAMLEAELARRGKATIWQPEPTNLPQVQAYESPAFEILYGGAAGGGKSDLILGLARTQHLNSLLLRREFPDLKRSLIARSLEFYGTRDLYNASDHMWNLPSCHIEFGHVEHMGSAINDMGDEDQYASAPYDMIGIDQLEQFNRWVYEFMFSRVRTTMRGQRTQIVSSMNPVGEYLDWIIERWGAWLDDKHSRPAKSGEIRYYKRDSSGHDMEATADNPDALGRTFIASRLADNKYLGEDYRKTLMALPEPLRSALMNGDIKAALQDDAYQVIPRAWVKAAMARWRPDGRPKDINGNLLRMSCLGADIARGGDDKEVLAPRYGRWYDRLTRLSGASVPDGARAVKPMIDLLESCGEATRTDKQIEYKDAGLILPVMKSDVKINVDVIGIGSSAYDTARTQGLNAIGVNFGEGSQAFDKSRQMKFKNKRAEHYWRFRESLDPTNDEYKDNPPCLPDDSQLLADLCAAHWKAPGGELQIESKEDIKKRIGRSPDDGDAVVLASADESGHWYFEMGNGK